MPLYDYRCCYCGTVVEHYFHKAADAPSFFWCEDDTYMCIRLPSLPNMLQYFSESNGRVIQNLGGDRVLHSPAAHQQLCKKRGVEYATQWHTSSLKQTDGLTTKARPGKKTLF